MTWVQLHACSKNLLKLTKHLNLKLLHLTVRFIKGADVSVIANLPNQEKALTMLASVLQAPISKLGRLITALKEKRVEAGLNPIFTPFNIHLELFSWL